MESQSFENTRSNHKLEQTLSTSVQVRTESNSYHTGEHDYGEQLAVDNENLELPPSKISNAKRKILRNTGREYISTSGKIVPERSPRELVDCRNKCKEVITSAVQQQIFRHYWHVLGSYLARQCYASNLIEIHETKTVRKQKSLTNPRNRQYAYKYFLKVNDEKVAVCQKCFRSTLCESEQFIKTLIKKKQETSGVFTGNDERGKHSKKSTENESELMEIINEFATASKPSGGEVTAADELQISKSYKIKFEKIGSLEVLTRKRIYHKKTPVKKTNDCIENVTEV